MSFTCESMPPPLPSRYSLREARSFLPTLLAMRVMVLDVLTVASPELDSSEDVVSASSEAPVSRDVTSRLVLVMEIG